LLMVTHAPGTATPASFTPTYDGNGNVSEYLTVSANPNLNGTTDAHLEYDPFGNTLPGSTWGAEPFAHRFSTKLQDSVSGLYYYSYRWYDPITGRWPSRDPIGERGGENLYKFTSNAPLSRIDLLGLEETRITKEVPKDKDCWWTIYIGHTLDVVRQAEQDKRSSGDRGCGVSCRGNWVNANRPKSPFGGPDKTIPNTPGVERYLYPDPQHIPKGWPAFDPNRDGDIDIYSFSAIRNAQREAEKACESRTDCCKTIEIVVRCTRFSARIRVHTDFGGVESYEDIGVRFGPHSKSPCSYRNKLDCTTGRWASPHLLDEFETGSNRK